MAAALALSKWVRATPVPTSRTSPFRVANWANAHFRFEVNYGKALLDRKGLSGQTDFWQFRAQFEL